MIESLSIDQARKLVLHSQKLPPVTHRGSALSKTLSAIEHLGYIQIDTISAVQRAHHHTLWNRNPRYKPEHLDQLLKEKQIFEYWSHAAAYLPMRDYRYSLYRKHAIAQGHQSHWYERDEPMMKEIINRIETEGPLMARDFEHNGHKGGEWSHKPAKRALEYLFMQGDLMVSHRVNFHKVYDLTERVLPKHTNITLPSPDEYARFLITSYLRSNGLGQPPEMSYLLKHIKSHITKELKEMLLAGEVIQVIVAGTNYYALPDFLELLNKPLSRSRLKILSPFDNLLIQRKRMKVLFNYDYLLECYLPESKRQYGYFSLPILWDGKLVARMDCKVDRKTSTLNINHLALEPSLKKIDEFHHALDKELKSFLAFNNCTTFKLHKTTQATISPIISKT